MRCAVQVGVGVYLIKREPPMFKPARVLMVRHIDDGLWRVPGGGREPLEEPVMAARRELAEEVGIEYGAGTLGMFLTSFTNHEKYGEWLTFHFYQNVDSDPGAVLLETKYHDGLAWFNIANALGSKRNKIFEPTIKGLEVLEDLIYKGLF